MCAAAEGRQWAIEGIGLPRIIPRTFLPFLRLLVSWRVGGDTQNSDWPLLKPGLFVPTCGQRARRRVAVGKSLEVKGGGAPGKLSTSTKKWAHPRLGPGGARWVSARCLGGRGGSRVHAVLRTLLSGREQCRRECVIFVLQPGVCDSSQNNKSSNGKGGASQTFLVSSFLMSCGNFKQGRDW